MNQVQEKPESALPTGPLPSARAVWVTAVLAAVLALGLALAVPRLLEVPSPALDCTIGSATYDETYCSDEPPAQEDLIDTEGTR